VLFDDANYRKEKHPSNNWNIFGADTAVETLRTHIASGLINRSYMFIGPSGIGKSRLALRFAQSVFAPLADDPTSPDLNHETAHRIEAGEFGDIHFIAASEDSKTGRSKATDIRQFIHSADLKPFNSKHRFVIFEADIASDAGRSATLKFLEEPPRDTTLIILPASRQLSVLDAMRSSSGHFLKRHWQQSWLARTWSKI
jgi:DNA polymerase III gamma/tau subunit